MIYGYYKNEADRKKLIGAGATKLIEGHPAPLPLLGGDTLIVSSFDTLAYVMGIPPKHMLEEISHICACGIRLIILEVGTFDQGESGKSLLNALTAYEGFRKRAAVDRLRIGKQVAKTKAGFREGRPRKDTTQALRLLGLGVDYETIQKITGISKSTILRRLRESKQ